MLNSLTDVTIAASHTPQVERFILLDGTICVIENIEDYRNVSAEVQLIRSLLSEVG